MLDSVKEGYDVKLKKETDQAWEFVCTKSKTNTKKDDPKKINLVISKTTYLPIRVSAQGSQQFHCYVCTCLGIGEGVMVIRKVVSAGGGHGLELVIGEQAAIMASGC